jgi:putative nucleotidyltransferase with HDIG domain
MGTSEPFVTCDVADIPVGEHLPVDLFVFLSGRFITFRAKGDAIDRQTFDRLQLNQVQFLFVRESQVAALRGWLDKAGTVEPAPPPAPELKNFHEAREDVHRKTMDIFLSEHPDRLVNQAISASKRLVNEVMAAPFATRSLTQLQTYSKGTVDHSVNVSVLSVYLALQMGYSHALILHHIGLGALLHDIGKTKVQVLETDSKEEIERKLMDHPTLGVRLISDQSQVSNEASMIIAQHHENWDGTGYPAKMKGAAIYDLARIVSIANVFDELVGDGHGSLGERQKAALKQLDEELYKRFDPQKLEKALKILRLGV